MGKWFGPDIVALSVPITFAAIGFSAMIARAFLIDPEWSNTGTAYYESEKAHDHAKTYSTQYSQFFHVGNFSKTSIFPNRVEINKN